MGPGIQSIFPPPVAAIRGGLSLEAAQIEQNAMHPQVIRRVKSHPLLRVKSYGEATNSQKSSTL